MYARMLQSDYYDFMRPVYGGGKLRLDRVSRKRGDSKRPRLDR
jgi:hypothetical protein